MFAGLTLRPRERRRYAASSARSSGRPCGSGDSEGGRVPACRHARRQMAGSIPGAHEIPGCRSMSSRDVLEAGGVLEVNVVVEVNGVEAGSRVGEGATSAT